MRRLDVEIVVVGAGVMGLATARELARAGRAVALVEQFRVGHARGSSHGRSRIFRLSYPDARWVRLAQEAVPLWGELEAEAGETLIERHGSLDLGDWRPNREALAETGIAFEILGGNEIARRFPLDVGTGETGLFQADGGIVRADARARRAARLGCGGRGSGARGDAHRGARAGRDRRDGFRRRRLDPGRRRSSSRPAPGRGLCSSRMESQLDVTSTRETVSYFSLEPDEPVPVADRLRRRGWSGTARLRARRARTSG